MELADKSRAYYQANKDKWREYRARRTPEQRQRDLAANRAWYAANKDKYKAYRDAAKESGSLQASMRRRNLRHKYGLTEAQYDAMVMAQGGVCAVCGEVCKTYENLCVDHCHKTGKVRGLLCMSCNVAIGKMKDSPELLYRAAVYLQTQG